MNKIRFYGLLLIFCLFAWNTAAAQKLPDFVSIVKQNYSAVVNISTMQVTTKVTEEAAIEIPGVDESTPLYDFLRYLLKPSKPRGNKNKGYREQSLGSGFIISNDGYILTNAHVIHGATQIIVTLSDYRELPAELVGIDTLTDVALLKIDEHNLPAVSTDEKTQLEIGQWVLAIGSPFGLDHTASQGIISGLGRSLPRETYVPFIQTDVAINPGNSGGPLFDTSGKVVGINSQIYTKSGGSIGLSFAIPIGVALDVAQQLKAQGEVRRGWLGVTTQDLTQDLALSFGLKIPMGALVSGIVHGSPAEDAGILSGDILVEYDNQRIERSANLIHMLGVTKVNTNVLIELIRDGEIIEVNVKVTELNKNVAAKLALAESGDLIIKSLNIKVNDLTDDQRDYMRIPKNGVLVKSVYRGIASKSGVHKGDVILKFDNHRIENAEQLDDLVSTLDRGKFVPVLIQRRNGPLFLTIFIPQH